MKKAIFNLCGSKSFEKSGISLFLIFAIAGLSMLFNQAAFAQKSLSEIAEMNDKQWDKLVKSHKTGLNHIYAVEGLIGAELFEKENMPDPKKIGVLTFQLWDESTWKSSSAGGWVYYEKNFITEEGSNFISNELLGQMLPVVESKFSEVGIEVQEPDEYIDNEEERTLYNEGPNKIELSGILKVFSGGLLDRLQGKKDGQGTVSADGYEFYPITPSILSSDYKAPSTLGLLAEDLGVDALLVVAVRVSIEKAGKLLVCNGIEMGLYGPVADDESIDYSGVIGAKTVNIYRGGMMYSTAFFEVEEVPLGDMDKNTGEITQWYTDGLPTITERMMDDMIYGLEKFKAMDTSK
ncbi:hypothetical protein [Algoriphagus limi]|uniref:Uncharacterized protein n=1 Tax=Algoriphagus limi TaxID=2975273 RepID=A0ABT2G2N7_9BACT|nr:hypothetical protein [Algoriphagus limi]MCS5489529.1 hypothetical protein [Algoriphagus limi]